MILRAFFLRYYPGQKSKRALSIKLIIHQVHTIFWQVVYWKDNHIWYHRNLETTS